MNLKEEITAYEVLPTELIGKAIQIVNYYEINYGDDEAAFELENHHSLDYGLQIETSDKQHYYFIWDSQKIQYDLKFKKGRLIEELNPQSNFKSHDVSGLTHWIDRIGINIEMVKSYWSYVQTVGKHAKRYYPQDLELTFTNGLNVTISALEIRTDGFVNSMADHISVFFDSATAKKYRAQNKL